MTATLFPQQDKSIRKGIGIFFFLVAALLLLYPPAPAPASPYAAAQLAEFGKSRPGVTEVMTESGEVYKFLLEAFSGAYTSVPLAWDPQEPNDNAYAEHKPNLQRQFINIRVSSQLIPLDQVACVVYEAVNAQNEKQFARLTEEAHNGFLTKTEFIHRILKLEHKSLKKTRAFLSAQEPYKSVDLSTTVFYDKMMGTPDEFEPFLEYLHQIKRQNYDVFKHYSDFYDFVIPPTKRWKAEQRALAAESEKAGHSDKEQTEQDQE